MLSYKCAEQNGLPQQTLEVSKGTLHLNEEVSWRLGDLLRGLASAPPELPRRGWRQCAAIPALPFGLTMNDAGRLHGRVRYDATRAAAYNVSFVAYNSLFWQNNATGLVRLEFHLDVEGNIPEAGLSSYQPGSANSEKAEEQVRLAFSAYEQWEKEQY